ncbi:metallophosphoesterase family protein [Candidatus Bathyarchaeota archaeon]|nr:metallophosphoesterase family protein [Candidatus Bathyarchaeota archaeon]
MEPAIKILAGTDFHGFKSAFEALAQKAENSGVNIVILCGDITNFGTEQQARSLLSPLSRLSVPVIFVPGNCDPPSLTNINLDNIRCIHGSGLIHANFAFIGVGGSPKTPFNTLLEMGEGEIYGTLQKSLKDLGDRINNSQTILISHAPPKNTNLDTTSIGGHVGSISVRKFIEEYKPALTLCGHIHEAKGVDKIGETLIVNPGPSKQGNYAIIDILYGRIDVKFHAFKTI